MKENNSAMGQVLWAAEEERKEHEETMALVFFDLVNGGK